MPGRPCISRRPAKCPYTHRASCWSCRLCSWGSSLILNGLDRKVFDRVWNLLEPVRSACRDDNDITFGQSMNFAAFDVCATPLILAALFSTDYHSPGDERRVTFHNVEDVCLCFVNFHLTGHVAGKHADGVVRRGHQRS